MNKDKSLQNIDITSLLIYILILVAVCLAMIFTFIAPSIKEYKHLKNENKIQSLSTAQIEQIYKTKTDTLQKIKQDNKPVLDAFEAKFDEVKFKEFALRFFEKVELKNISPNSDEQFFLNEISLLATMQTPIKFYEFIDTLQHSGNIAKIEFPIKMHREGAKIDATFHIKFYGLR